MISPLNEKQFTDSLLWFVFQEHNPNKLDIVKMNHPSQNHNRNFSFMDHYSVGVLCNPKFEFAILVAR